MEKMLKKEGKLRDKALNQVSTNKKTLSKSKKQIDKDYYQKHKERKKEQRKARYQQQKKQIELSTKQQLGKYYETEAIKILMSFKEYIELSKDNHKLWLDFTNQLKDLTEKGVNSIVEIMKLRESVESLINDYWATAKNKIKQRSKNWNSLDYDEQQKLIRYWGYERARKENNYLTINEQLKQQSKEYLKEIEITKFHEERGKSKCSCFSCSEKKQIQAKISEENQKINSYPKNMFCLKCQKGNTQEYRIRIRCGSANMKKMCANNSCNRMLKN